MKIYMAWFAELYGFVELLLGDIVTYTERVTAGMETAGVEVEAEKAAPRAVCSIIFLHYIILFLM